MYELPPILNGNPTQQLASLRAYLVRMAQQLNGALGAEQTQGLTAAPSVSAGAKAAAALVPGKDGGEEIRKNARELRALIVKTADGLSGDIIRSQDQQRLYTDAAAEKLSSTLVARSEFGTFTEKIESRISESARGVVESYNYDSLISSAEDSIAVLQSYMTSLDGEIRRGIVTDPETDEEVTGIAISQNLQFTGAAVKGADGAEYYRLSSGQTFGLYTSTGWQFWIDGHKRGWYNSVDGMLHIANTAIEDTLQIGGAWRVLNEGGLGIKYTGG